MFIMPILNFQVQKMSNQEILAANKIAVPIAEAQMW